MGQPWQNGYDGVDAVGEIRIPPAPNGGSKTLLMKLDMIEKVNNSLLKPPFGGWGAIFKYLFSKAPIWGLGVLFFIGSHTFAADIYVSPSGKDTNDGSIATPKATLSAALRQARELRRQNATGIENGIQIILKGGTYAQYEPVYVRPEDSGTPQSPTIICGVANENVVLSGGVKIGNWKKSGNFLVANVPNFNGRPLDFRQLWVNGKKAVRARDVVDFEDMNRIVRNDKANQILWVPAKAVKAIQKAPYAEMVLHQMWAVSFLRIKSIQIQGDSAAVRFHNPEGKLQFERPWPQPMIAPGRNSAFYLTNAIELLDQPGEWYHDIHTHKLYYYPLKNENEIEAIAPAIETLVEVEGTTDRPVENVFFKNIQFSHTTWMRPSEKGHVPLQAGMYMTEAYRLNPQIERIDNHKLDNQGWLGRGAAAVSVKGANNINFEDCRFENLGFSGLDYLEGTSDSKTEGCVFKDIAGNGLVAGSFSPASLETHLPYNPQDKREICSGLLVKNNVFTNVTNEDWGCDAIAAGYVRNTTIEHNDISQVSYMGINLGWGWNRNLIDMKSNTVRANNIYLYARHMYDVAAIYTLGAQPKTVISENYIHDIYAPGYVHDPHHWFYLYNDEGSSFMTVKNNWVPAEKFLQNANGPNNLWSNNNAFVHDSVKTNAGLQLRYRHLLKEVNTKPEGKLQEIPHFAALEFIGEYIDTAVVMATAKANGVIKPQLYKWNKHTVLYAKMNQVENLKAIYAKLFPEIALKTYDNVLYQFSKSGHCKSVPAQEWEHTLLTCNLVDDPKLQQEYIDYHATQFEKWPEVSAGFCNAGFQQLQVFKNGRQLLLVISIPKGSNLDELNPKTTENNPRVNDWNSLMKKYQTGIEGTKPGEVWVELTK